MKKVLFYAPDIYNVMLRNLRKIPFAKTEGGYVFASWIYDLNYDALKQEELLNSENGKEAAMLLEEAKARLDTIMVTEDDYLAWTVRKKEKGGLKQYHDIIQNLSINLLMLSINTTAESIKNEEHNKEDHFYTVSYQQKEDDSRIVLNRNNPFADVTIKSQQFFYKTADTGTETLFFDTNNIVDKIEKNGKNLLTMHPGFSVTKEHGVARKPIQKVTFSNTLTEPIVGDEEHIYIHID